MGFFDDWVDTAQAMTLDENKVANLERMRQRYHQNREMRIRQEALERSKQQNASNSSGDGMGKLLVGAAVLGGAFLLKKVFGSDEKEQTQQAQPNK